MKIETEIVTVILFIVILFSVFFVSCRMFTRNKILKETDVLYGRITLKQQFFAKAYHTIATTNPKLLEKDILCIIVSAYNMAIKHKENPYLYLSIAMIESSFRPDAVGKDGELGLYQIMLYTAKKHLPFSIKKLKEILMFIGPNTTAATGEFHRLKKKYKGDIVQALIWYNRGEKNWKKKKKNVPKRTSEYALKILRAYYSLKKEEK